MLTHALSRILETSREFHQNPIQPNLDALVAEANRIGAYMIEVDALLQEGRNLARALMKNELAHRFDNVLNVKYDHYKPVSGCFPGLEVPAQFEPSGYFVNGGGPEQSYGVMLSDPRLQPT